MIRRISILSAILFLSANTFAGFSERFPIGYTDHNIIKQRILNGDTTFKAELYQLFADADKLLEAKPPSVMDDSNAPEGIDPHDYVSYAPYWWPNPKTESGLPYIRRDGEINNELRSKGDDKKFTEMAHSVYILSLAFYYSDDEKYAIHAEKFLSTWFLDALTKMNPNAEAGQIIPGKQDYGRRAGINEMRFLSTVIDGVELLSDSKSWTIAKNDSLKVWFSEYFEWFTKSEHGQEERIRPNNHGTWYDVQFVSIALFLDKDSLARQVIETQSINRIKSQIDTNGMQPLEVVRGFSLHYTIYNIKAFFSLATLAERVGIDLWNYKSDNGASIQLALDYVLPYVGHQELWPFDDKGRGQGKNWFVILSQAVYKYESRKYEVALEQAQVNGIDHCGYCYKLVVPN